MDSTNKINYDIRPAKFAERKMILSFLNSVCGYYGHAYQYIGFGGTQFTDFKLVHIELGLKEMISIEGGPNTNNKRVKFNKPFEFIKLEFGQSDSVLNRIDLSKKSIVWMDYDDDLDRFMFNDILTLFSSLPKGSIYIVTCNRQLKDKSTGDIYTVDRFEECFKGLVPFGIKKKDLNGSNNYKTIRKMFLQMIDRSLEKRDDNKAFYQLFNFLYQENGGAKMFSFGGLIEEKSFNVDNLSHDNFNFLKRKEEPYRIKMPLLTTKEMNKINEMCDDVESLKDMKIVLSERIDEYMEVYRYLPNFRDVRQ